MNDKIVNELEMALNCEMCRACPNSCKCHEECENCEEFEEELDKQLLRYGIER